MSKWNNIGLEYNVFLSKEIELTMYFLSYIFNNWCCMPFLMKCKAFCQNVMHKPHIATSCIENKLRFHSRFMEKLGSHTNFLSMCPI